MQYQEAVLYPVLYPVQGIVASLTEVQGTVPAAVPGCPRHFFRAHRRPGYGTGRRTKLTEVHGMVPNSRTRYPGQGYFYRAHRSPGYGFGSRTRLTEWARVRYRKSQGTHRSPGYGGGSRKRTQRSPGYGTGLPCPVPYPVKSLVQRIVFFLIIKKCSSLNPRR